MEAVFSNGDIAKQLPQEAKRFAGVDKDYMKLMHKAFEISNAVQCCHGYEPMKVVLPGLARQLEICQKSLHGYFESKRLLFPRFFFISDTLLLELLGDGSEPQKIMGHISMLFDSLAKVEFDENDSMKMLAMIADDGEYVKLSAPLECGGLAEEYLEKLVGAMRATIHDISRECAQDVIAWESHLMEHLFQGFCCQVSLIGLQLYWTFQAEEALSKAKQDKLIMNNTAKKFDSDLKELTSLVNNQLGPSERILLESMITLQMYQKEAFDELVKQKVKELNDFGWQKQIRSTWKEQEDHCVVQMMDNPMRYQNEFFGCKERLVVTPLTSRCYITIFQALSMHLGVANFGPAGTGKTMAIKDIGRILGKYVVTFHCSNQIGVDGLSKVLKGVAMTGCWGCLDDFSSVDFNAISVAAQQMSTIILAKRARAKNFVFNDGDNGTLDENSAYFMTLLPSSDKNMLPLPENMKTQVRGIMMLKPDPVTIVRVKLSASGYKESLTLSKKLDTLFQMCRDCLSKQQHYDFGLRNLCSFVTACGRTMRMSQNAESNESQMVVQTLKETNLGCLTQEDCTVFLDMIASLFPGVSGDKLENVKQSGIMRTICDSMYLEYDSISAIRWVEKLTFFHEICQVRHGVGLVGPTGSGKSSILKTSVQTFGEMLGVQQTIKTLNPKAVDIQQLFGNNDVNRSKWSEGIFSTLWRRAGQSYPAENWIVFDGPVDLEWMENLNTALDDTRVLSLANGDRLPLPSNLRIILEADHLDHASPAAVSRIGVVFVSSATLGYEPLVSSWLKSRPEAQSVALREILNKCFTALVNTASRILKTVLEVPVLILVQNMLRILEMLLSKGKGSEHGDQPQPVLERMILFSICWSFGGPVESDGRTRLEAELKKLLPKAFPHSDMGKPFDCFLEDDGDWSPMSTVSTEFQFPMGADYLDVYVPTIHDAQYRMLFEMVAPRKQTILLLGGVGIGKTATLHQFTRDRAHKGGLTTKRIVLSADTLPLGLQRAIESATEKRQGRIYGPSHYRTCCVFIDDMNVPNKSKWGDQPANELFRQLISDGGFFNLDKPGEWKVIKDLEFVTAMTHPGGGRQDLPTRLKRRMLLINMCAPPHAALNNIFSAIVSGYFCETNVGADTASVAIKFAEPTVRIWGKLQERLTPTVNKFHYKYTVHDLSNVFRGMLRCHQDLFDGKDYVAKLWKHECERAFTDKLSSNADKFMVNSLILETMDETLGAKLAAKCNGSIYFCPFVQEEEDRLLADGELDPDALFQPYELCESFDDIQRKVQGFLDKYNTSPEHKQRMDLVLFEYAIEYLLKIVRAICFDGGSCLLIGLKASGKQSLATLATFILDQKVLRVRPSNLYTRTTLLEDLKTHCKRAALENQHFTFLLAEADILEESFLDFVNQLIFTGEITDMFSKDEISQLVSEPSFRSEVQRSKPEWSESTENLTKFFVRRVRLNLHCILCFTPSDPKLLTRIRCYPAIMSYCHLIWFTSWPAEGLQMVAEHSFSRNKIKMQHQEEVLRHLPEVQDFAHGTSLEFLKQGGQRVHVTSLTYLLFLRTYAHVFQQKDTELHLAIKRFKKAVHKLDQLGEDIKEMVADIDESETFLLKAQHESADLLKQITNQQSVADRKKTTFDEATKQHAVLEEQVLSERAAVGKELEVAAPYVKDAQEALGHITPKDIQTLKAIKNPQATVKVIMDSVLLILSKPMNPIKVVDEKGASYYRDSYAASVMMMNDGTYLDQVQAFHPDRINDETMEFLQPYLNNSLFNPDAARKLSGMASYLGTWVENMDKYCTFASVLRPRRNRLFNKEMELRQAKKSLDAADADLTKVREQLEEMQQHLRDAVNEKAAIQTETELTREKVKSANTLIRALASDKVRWMSSAGDYQLRLAALPGDASVAACFLTYCGQLSKDLRIELCELVQKDLRQKSLPRYESFNLQDLLSKDGERRDWKTQGLPEDSFSIENGILVSRALCWPLLIDPEGQGLAWINQREKNNMMKTTTFGDNRFHHILAECITHGCPLLIENVNEELDPIIESILDKRLALSAGDELQLQIGDRDVTSTKGFALYLMTKMPKPDFSPEISAQVTVIDFRISIDLMQEQFFTQIIERERPEFHAQRLFTVGEVNNLQRQAVDLDDDVLMRLYSIHESGSILDDDGLLDVLEKIKEIDRMVKEKVKIVDGLSKKIDQSCAEFKSVAKRACALYSVMLDLAHVNPMYNTSIHQFRLIFQRVVANAPRENNLQLKIQSMNQSLTWDFFRAFRRGIFDKDQELLKLLIGIKHLIFEGSVTEEHFRCFIDGGAHLDADQVTPKPYNWILVDSWLNIMALFDAHPVLKDLPESIKHLGDNWRSWYDHLTPELQKLPDIPSAFDKITPFLQLSIVRAFRPDRVMEAAKRFVREVLNDAYNVTPACDLETIYFDSGPRTPLIFLLSSGDDPTGLVLALARKIKREVLCVSMGQDQHVVARRNFDTGIQIGSWVLLQNVHLDTQFLSELELSFYKVESIEADFRLFMTTEVTQSFPLGLVQMSMKVTNEPPAGVKAGLRVLYSLIKQDMIEATPRVEWRSLLFSLSFMHSVMQSRRQFGRSGWSSPCDFSHADFVCAATFLQNHLKEVETKKRKEINWETLRQMLVHILYGGDRSDEYDLRVIRTLSEKYIAPLVLETNFQFALGYPMPTGSELASFRASIEAFPAFEKPEVIGMSSTSDFVLGLEQANDLFSKLAKTLVTETPSVRPGTASGVLESAMLPRIEELLQKLPHPFAANEIRESLEKDGGSSLPLNVAFQHELDVFGKVVSSARNMLQRIHVMLNGLVASSDELNEAAQDIHSNKVPRSWEKISWESQHLGHWLQQLQNRQEQWKRWLERGRPFSLWLAGFTNPVGFLSVRKDSADRSADLYGIATSLPLLAESAESLHCVTFRCVALACCFLLSFHVSGFETGSGCKAKGLGGGKLCLLY